jgi:protein TonB
MIESTARVERVSAEPASRSGYTWEVPQKPVSVHLPFDLIDKLESLVVESFRSLTSRGSEIGGLLLGRDVAGNPATVSVEEFELVTCDYTRGPLYRLSEADMGRFERAIEKNSSGEPRVVGFFRSHTRKGLSLDSDDLAFLDARFREAHQIALLIRPFATKASTAGVFIRENGTIHAEASYLEFPFRSSQLAASAAPPVAQTGAAAEPSASAATNAPAAPAAPKPPIRGQIVPIAPRREIPVPAAPASEPIPEPVPAIESSQPAVVPAPAPAPAPAPKPPAEPVVRTEEKSLVRRSEKAEKPERAEIAQKAGRTELIPTKASTEVAAMFSETPAARRGSKVVWAVALLALAGVAGGGYFLYPGFHKTSGTLSAGGTSPLNLRVEHSGPDLLLTWNRDAAGVKNAAHAVLSISDGERHENYDMDPGQLFNGSIVYSPLTPDVSFRLEVTGQNHATIASESVRVLRTRPSPMDDPKSASKTQTPSTPAKSDTAAPASQPSAEETPAPEKSAAVAAPTRAFDSSSLAKRLRQPSSTDLPDAPSIGGAGASPQAGSLPGASLSGIAPAPQARQTPPPPASGRNAGGQISPAELVYKHSPEYPKIAQQMGVKGVVELMATIGTDGKVKGVRVLSGPPMLQKAAKDAVMQWVYKPTLLNGTPVENETHISINFSTEK